MPYPDASSLLNFLSVLSLLLCVIQGAKVCSLPVFPQMLSLLQELYGQEKRGPHCAINYCNPDCYSIICCGAFCWIWFGFALRTRKLTSVSLPLPTVRKSGMPVHLLTQLGFWPSLHWFCFLSWCCGVSFVVVVFYFAWFPFPPSGSFCHCCRCVPWALQHVIFF